MKFLNIWIAAAAVVLSAASTASAVTLINGSLTGTIGSGVVPSGWTLNLVTPDITSSASQPFTFNVNPGDSPDGGTWVALARNQSIFESFGQMVTDFVVGTSYTLSWYVTNTGCCGGGFSAAAEILSDIDGTTSFTGATIAQGENWFLESYSFLATSTSHTLDFRLTTGAQAYMGIDGISLVETIPLPAAFPLFATALAGMGLLGWRRKRKASASV